ncbi:MAG: hypothetical protein GY798_17095, partial [Hyphomicrobiales bacterium]|nr:hypothetical protein [Hyphomicrobiales bacterium]
GETLSVNVGGQGEPGQSYASPGRPAHQGGAGGWNGGGTGGDGYSASGGGGGGATDIRQGGTDLGDRVVVAGGGGGSGAFSHQDVVGDAEARLLESPGLGRGRRLQIGRAPCRGGV